MSKFIFELVKLIMWILPPIFFIYLAFILILNNLFPDLPIGVSQRDILALNNRDLGLILILVLSLSFLGFLITVRGKKTKIRSPFRYAKSQVVILAASAYFFATFFSKTFFNIPSVEAVLTIALTIFFLILIPNLINFFISPDLSYFSQRTFNSKLKTQYLLLSKYKPADLIKRQDLFWGFLKTVFAGAGSISFLLIIVVFLAWQLNRYANYQKYLRENLTITSVAPTKTTLAQKVALRGYNFGWRLGEKDSLVSSFGPVVVDEWKGEEIIFTVPLHWKEGTVMLWIVRTKNDQPKGDLIKSNTVSLEIVSRWDFFPAEEELKNKDVVSYFKRGVKKLRRMLFLKQPYFP